MRRKIIILVLVSSLLTTLCLFGLGVLFFAHPSLDTSLAVLPKAQVDELRALGREAIKSKDVPVGALLLYDGKIIGRGFNTVSRDKDPAGHAEVNAIRDAFGKLGLDGYSNLDKSKLLIISTFEPCPLCQGAMQIHKISRAKYVRSKPLTQLLREHAKSLRYQWNRESVGPEGLQESLFLLHPDYPGKKNQALKVQTSSKS